MAKMKKEDLEKMRRENPAENNWEVISDQCSVDSGQGHEEGRMKNEEEKGLGTGDSGSAAGAVVPDGGKRDKKDFETPEELKEVFGGIPADLPGRGELKKRIHQDWLKVDPAVRGGNPVWKFSVKDDKIMKCTVFLFRSGQKVRILTPVEAVNPEFK